MGLYENKNGVLSPIAGRGNIDGVYKAQGILGAKNLIPYPYSQTTKTASGITFTDNGDGSVTVNGTATADVYMTLFSQSGTNFILPKGSYKGSGCPSGGSDSTYQIRFQRVSSNTYIYKDKGNGVDFEFPEAQQCGVYIFIYSGATLSNVTFKPMLRLASDPDDAYVPFAMTNRELTERIKTIVSEAVTEAFSAHATKWHDNANDCNVGFERTNNYRTSNMPTTGTEQTPVWYNIMTVREGNNPESVNFGYGFQIAVQTTSTSTMGDIYVRAVNGGANPTWSEWKKLN